MTYAGVGLGLDVPTPMGPQNIDPTKSLCGSLVGLKQMLKDLGYYKGDVLAGGQQSAKDAISKFSAEHGYDPYVTPSLCNAIIAAWMSKPKTTIVKGKLGFLFRPTSPTTPVPQAPASPTAPAQHPSTPAPSPPAAPPPALPPPLLNEPPLAPETPYAPVLPPPEPVVVGTGTTAVFPMKFAIAAAVVVAMALILRGSRAT